MNGDMLNQTKLIVKKLKSEKTQSKKFAQEVKKFLEQKYGGNWLCFVGETNQNNFLAAKEI